MPNKFEKKTNFDYDEKHDVLYIALKNCPSYYVDERVDNDYIDLHCSFKIEKIVGATIWRASEFF